MYIQCSDPWWITPFSGLKNPTSLLCTIFTTTPTSHTVVTQNTVTSYCPFSFRCYVAASSSLCAAPWCYVTISNAHEHPFRRRYLLPTLTGVLHFCKSSLARMQKAWFDVLVLPSVVSVAIYMCCFVLVFGIVHDIVQETGMKTIPMEKKRKKAKWLSGETLQIAV